MRRIAVLAAGALLATSCSVADLTTDERPQWVNDGVRQIRAKFIGNPQPVRITWSERGKTRTVSVWFRNEYICGGCHSSPRAREPLRARGGYVEFRKPRRTYTVFGLLP